MNLFVAIIVAASGTFSNTVTVTFEVFTNPGSCMLYKNSKSLELEGQGYQIQKAQCVNTVSK